MSSINRFSATLRIKNFSVDRTQSSNDGSMFFVFGTDPYISSSTASTYEVILHWTEKISGHSSSLTISRYSTSCPTNGYFRTDGSTHHFSVSKYSLGSGPLSLYISVSLVCTSRYDYCNYRCSYGSWGYKGTSETITIDAVRGEEVLLNTHSKPKILGQLFVVSRSLSCQNNFP